MCYSFLYGVSSLFRRRIEGNEDVLIFHYGPFTYNLHIDKVSIYREEIFVFGGNFKKRYGLVLYRNRKKAIGFSLNNRFILAYEIDEAKLDFYKKELKSKFNIYINIIQSAS